MTLLWWGAISAVLYVRLTPAFLPRRCCIFSVPLYIAISCLSAIAESPPSQQLPDGHAQHRPEQHSDKPVDGTQGEDFVEPHEAGAIVDGGL